MTQHRIQCSEVWGGIHSIDLDVMTSGVAASVYCQAYDGDLGGDIYYFSVCSSDKLTRIALADVRGHGARVGHISTWVHDSLHERRNTLEGEQVLADLNSQIHSHGFEALTTAAVLGYYLKDSTLYFSYAGHSPALLWRRSEPEWKPLLLNSDDPATNPVLGALPAARFEQRRTCLEPGDRFLLYTDGVVDCVDQRGDEFGEQRLLALLQSAPANGVTSMKTSLVSALHRHTGSSSFADDLTFLFVEVR